MAAEPRAAGAAQGRPLHGALDQRGWAGEGGSVLTEAVPRLCRASEKLTDQASLTQLPWRVCVDAADLGLRRLVLPKKGTEDP